MMTENKIGFLQNFLYTLFLFLFLYQFRLEIIGLPPMIHSTRCGALGLFILGILKNDINNKDIYGQIGVIKYLKLCVFIFIYGLILLLIQGKGVGIHITDVILNNLLITIPVIWALTNIFDDINSFFKVLIYVGLIQSVFIVLCLINEPFQLFIDNMFNNTESETHNVLMLRKGYAGGIGCITSSGMIRYTISIIATSYLYVLTRKFIYFLVFVIFAILNAMIARTGLLVDLCCFLYITLQIKDTKSIFSYILSILLIVGYLYFVIDTGHYNSFIEERFHRFDNLRDNGMNEEFFNGYLGGMMPNLSDNLVFGVGIISGTASDATIVNIDGGFFRIYSALGLLCAIVIYFILFKIMIENISIQEYIEDRDFMILILMFFLIAEFKEMTFFVAWPLSIYFTISHLLIKSNQIG